MAGLIVWIELMPPGFDSIRGLNPLAAAEWRSRFHLPNAALPARAYRACFQVWQVAVWVPYGALVAVVLRGARLTSPWTWRLGVPVVVVTAFAMPAALSTDVFAYVGYARLAVVHGLNPHVATQLDLVRLGDPTSPYLHWPIASPYGPLWTMLCIAVVAVGERVSAGSVWGSVVVLKLIAATGVLGMAAFARRLVPRDEAAGRGDATFVLVVTNPLLLCEGPGTGHNDVVMMALALAGFAAWLTPAPGGQRRARAALAFGGAAAVKLIPLLILPWLATSAARSKDGGGRLRPGPTGPPRLARIAAIVAAILALGLAPVVVSYAPFWAGGQALGGLAQRWRQGGGAVAVGREEVTPEQPRAVRSANPAPVGVPGQARTLMARLVEVARRIWVALLVYVAATAAILLREGDPLLPLTAWAYVAWSIMLFVAGLWFPWYLAWTWPAVLVRSNRHHQALALLLFLFSVLLMMVYGTAP